MAFVHKITKFLKLIFFTAQRTVCVSRRMTVSHDKTQFFRINFQSTVLAKKKEYCEDTHAYPNLLGTKGYVVVVVTVRILTT
jgi:hypothetical protein